MALFEVTKSNITSNLLSDRFIVNPFSILDAKSGIWRKQRQFWYDILKTNDDIRHETQISNRTPASRKDTSDYATDKFYTNIGTSLFDPFLCEIIYKWFSLPKMTILDPFAGGHARGMVASCLGRNYVGFDINASQVEFNESCKKSILDKYNFENGGEVEWITSDVRNVYVEDFDMVFSCPPYYNLEKYTDLGSDLSNKATYEEFLKEYREIIKTCFNALKMDSFAVFVVGEIRDNNGIYYGFVPDTIRAFTDAGFKYYNEIILENTIGSLPVRCPRHFDESRKIGKQHQNVLVFYKGDTKNIHNKFGDFDKFVI